MRACVCVCVCVCVRECVRAGGRARMCVCFTAAVFVFHIFVYFSGLNTFIITQFLSIGLLREDNRSGPNILMLLCVHLIY